MEAALEVKEECGYDIVPEIMIPLVGEKKELKFVKDIVVEIAELVKKEKNSDIQYHISTMIEFKQPSPLTRWLKRQSSSHFGTLTWLDDLQLLDVMTPASS